jgi:ferredoxin
MRLSFAVISALLLCLLGAGAFRLRAHTLQEHRLKRSCVALSESSKSYSIRLINKKTDMDLTYEMPANKFLLDAAEEKSIPIPYSCRAGSCSSCLGRLIDGAVDQSNQIFLEDDKIEEGYILTCVAYPLSDCHVEVDIEDEFYNS